VNYDLNAQSSKYFDRRDQPWIFERSSPFCGRQSHSRNLFLDRRLRTTLVKRSMRAKAHSCFGVWNAPGFYIECSSCSSSRRSAGWAVRQTVRTKSTEKRQLGANNLCYVLPPSFPPLSPSFISFLLISFSLLLQQRYVLCLEFVRLFSIPTKAPSATRTLLVALARCRAHWRGENGIWNWGKPLMKLSRKSPVKVTELPSQWITHLIVPDGVTCALGLVRMISVFRF